MPRKARAIREDSGKTIGGNGTMPERMPGGSEGGRSSSFLLNLTEPVRGGRRHDPSWVMMLQYHTTLPQQDGHFILLSSFADCLPFFEYRPICFSAKYKVFTILLRDHLCFRRRRNVVRHLWSQPSSAPESRRRRGRAEGRGISGQGGAIAS